jgi:hypothetical protein
MSSDTFEFTEYVKIVMGLNAYPGANASFSAETGIEEIVLSNQDTDNTGFSVSDFHDDWLPGRPGLKSGGVYSDNPNEDGKDLRNAH